MDKLLYDIIEVHLDFLLSRARPIQVKQRVGYIYVVDLRGETRMYGLAVDEMMAPRVSYHLDSRSKRLLHEATGFLHLLQNVGVARNIRHGLRCQPTITHGLENGLGLN